MMLFALLQLAFTPSPPLLGTAACSPISLDSELIASFAFFCQSPLAFPPVYTPLLRDPSLFSSLFSRRCLLPVPSANAHPSFAFFPCSGVFFHPEDSSGGKSNQTSIGVLHYFSPEPAPPGHPLLFLFHDNECPSFSTPEESFPLGLLLFFRRSDCFPLLPRTSLFRPELTSRPFFLPGYPNPTDPPAQLLLFSRHLFRKRPFCSLLHCGASNLSSPCVLKSPEFVCLGSSATSFRYRSASLSTTCVRDPRITRSFWSRHNWFRGLCGSFALLPSPLSSQESL